VFDRAVLGFSRVPSDADPGLLAGLRGLLEGGGAITPSTSAREWIKRLRSHRNPEIARAAAAVLAGWNRLDASSR
jgi:hypothetical protein